MPIATSGSASNIDSSKIVDGTIADIDVASDAAIARVKLENPLVCKVYKAADQNFTTSDTRIAFDTEAIDLNDAFDSNVYTAPVDENVLVLLHVDITATSSTDNWAEASIRVNGSAVRIGRQIAMDNATDRSQITLSEVLNLSATDVVDASIRAEGTLPSMIGGATASSLQIIRL